MADFEKALDQYDYSFKKGEIVKGKVIEQSPEGLYIDIGGKSPGFVPAREVGLQVTENLTNEQELEFLIIGEQNSEGQITLSRRQLEIQAAWDNITEMAEAGSSTQMRVTGVNKGGVTGEVAGLRAFIPRSHLQEKENLDALVGQSLTATFLEVNRETRKLVLSQRDAIRAAAVSKLEAGVLREGKVVSLKPYGAFVDLEGVTGLLHISEISNLPIPSLPSLLRVGQNIKVIISQIDEYKNRISLTLKMLEDYPGEIQENWEKVMNTAELRFQQAQAKLNQENTKS
ncbi:MAG: 30S ribosomal protein S1 [Cyanobacteria bacterium J083]|nr:MAG: 30S ribosomal protein S1 [Cyanobacteria bacterium J083]